MGIMRTKSVEQSIRDTEQPEFKLNKTLGALDLTVFGIGVMVGTGIFVLTGVAAATGAGPAISLSFVVAAIACGLAALCYAELASTVPVAGSAYTFSYAAAGEFIAWLIGWDLVLEFIVGGAAVSVGWSAYFNGFLENIGLGLPAALSAAPGEGGVVNIPAAAIVLILTAILVVGIGVSSRVNQIITAIKIGVILFFIGFGVFFVSTSNWSPFIPERQAGGETGTSLIDTPLLSIVLGSPGAFGVTGIVTGAAIVFFSYVGFDIVATTAEETRNPQRNLPLGILGSLVIVTILYVVVTLVMTGIVPYTELNTAAPMATAISATGANWATGLVTLGAIMGITSVIMVLMLGQSRIAFAMSRDGLLPPWLGRVHPRFRTPYRITIITGVLIAILAAFIPISGLAELLNIGTLFAFVLVSIMVVALRRRRPDLPRAFRAPLVPVVPALAVLSCLYLMVNLSLGTWLRFFGWMAIGILVYFLYSQHRSRLATGETVEDTARET